MKAHRLRLDSQAVVLHRGALCGLSGSRSFSLSASRLRHSLARRKLRDLRQHDWVVYAKRPFAGPTQVLEYLGRYTHRVAISNERLVSHTDGLVRFRWRDYADGDRVKIMTLAAEEFIRRFLLHVVPGGFVRIRHFGFLANRTRRAKLARCRALLAQPPAAPASAIESVAALMRRLTGIDIERCPVCQRGRLHLTEILAPSPPPTRGVPGVNTS